MKLLNGNAEFRGGVDDVIRSGTRKVAAETSPAPPDGSGLLRAPTDDRERGTTFRRRREAAFRSCRGAYADFTPPGSVPPGRALVARGRAGRVRTGPISTVRRHRSDTHHPAPQARSNKFFTAVDSAVPDEHMATQ
jgi:hypothetical protein